MPRKKITKENKQEKNVEETSKLQESKILDSSQNSRRIPKSQDTQNSKNFGAPKFKDFRGFDGSKTESFGSDRNSEEFRHDQKSNKKISDTAKEIGREVKEKVENIVEAAKEEVEELAGKVEEEEKIKEKKKKELKDEEKKGNKKETAEKKGEEKKEEIKERKITKKELEEKAKKLAEKIPELDIKEKLGEEREKAKAKKKTLVPIEDYVKYGCYIGTKVITPHLRQYVYKRRNDGIAIINTNLIDEKLKEIIELLVKYNPEDFIVVCKREAGWKVVETFARLTGVRIFTKKYPAGILTNPKLPSFFETEMVFICDPWMDRNAMNDAKKIKKPVLALCDTNNYTFDVDFFVPCNNKSSKSLGLIFYILAREYLKAKGIKTEVKIEDFVSEE